MRSSWKSCGMHCLHSMWIRWSCSKQQPPARHRHTAEPCLRQQLVLLALACELISWLLACSAPYIGLGAIVFLVLVSVS